MNNDVVIYQSSDGLVKMEAIVDASNETIWATQKAMAELFGVTVPNISYHFKRIFSSGELEPEMVIKEILITAQSGVRGLSEEKIKYYNLDAILSLGYRVNSVQATAFRKWATSILNAVFFLLYPRLTAQYYQAARDLKREPGKDFILLLRGSGMTLQNLIPQPVFARVDYFHFGEEMVKTACRLIDHPDDPPEHLFFPSELILPEPEEDRRISLQSTLTY